MIQRVHDFVLNHDDRWAFIIAYIGLALVLSLWISLFWLVAVVAVHGIFEWVCVSQRSDDVWARVHAVAWELKLDVALILFALALGVYMEFLLGVVGLGAAGRAGVQAGGRFAGWQNALRGALLSVDDVAQVARAVATTGGGGAPEDSLDILDGPTLQVAPEPLERWSHWRGDWSFGDRFALGFGALCTALIIAAPWIVDQEVSEVVATIAAELHPMPAGTVLNAASE